MFENEGSEIESTQSDVTQETSSESQGDSQQTQAAPAEQNVPFHEHPRWKEVMGDRDASNKRAEALEQQVAEMRRQLQETSKPKSQPKEDAMVARLMGIDPEFGNDYKSIKEQAALAAELQAELKSFREERIVESLKSKFEELASKEKLSDYDKGLYFSKMNELYLGGQLRDSKSLEAQFKAIHEPRAKQLEEIKRQAIEEYTKAKKADASKPTGQPKGKAATPGKVDVSKMNPQEARAAMTKAVVDKLRASRDI